MEIPFETIIKQFRASEFCKRREYVEQYSEDFFDYLTSEMRFSQAVEERNFLSIALDARDNVRRSFGQKLERLFASNAAVTPKKLDALLTEVLIAEIDRIKALPFSECYFDISEVDLFQPYNGVFWSNIGLISAGLYPLSQAQRDLLRDLVRLMLHRSYFSSHHTGLVFAGFGTKQLFPALCAFEIDGVIRGRIKRRKSRDIVIDSDGVGAEILPFAQKEMVDRFLYGVDAEFEEGAISHFDTAIRGIEEAIIEPVLKGSRKKRIVLSHLRQYADAASADARATFEENKRVFKQRIDNMVLFMPKQELANMAEALVNLTSTKRKVSAEQESVGGPIDVAVISKNDGFVWVKRKHYFDPVLNPRFFLRQLRNLAGGTPHA